MRYFSAQYIFTNNGTPLKRGIIQTDDEGVIISVEDTGGELEDKSRLEYYNGIIIPGLVNCHCHLELSHMKGQTDKKTGLGNFIEQVRSQRNSSLESIKEAAAKSDAAMAGEGVVLCADICNTDNSFAVKNLSRIRYINLLEVFGIDPSRSQKRFEEVLELARKSSENKLISYVVPHALYSTSLTLLRQIRSLGLTNRVTSVHFMESEGEKEFIENHKGPIAESYIRSGLMPDIPETVENHSTGVLEEITSAGNLILVHNTFANRETISAVNSRKGTFWCLCPGSNLYIEDMLPPVKMLMDQGCEIVIGTDSLASNDTISMISEMMILQKNFPSIGLEEIIKWATLNGARALDECDTYGKIEPGKKPGLVLLENIDLQQFNITTDTVSKRLI
jgi:cytosine/adenosine deaminase-related metal-dependent hydrolase